MNIRKTRDFKNPYKTFKPSSTQGNLHKMKAEDLFFKLIAELFQIYQNNYYKIAAKKFYHIFILYNVDL